MPNPTPKVPSLNLHPSIVSHILTSYDTARANMQTPTDRDPVIDREGREPSGEQSYASHENVYGPTEREDPIQSSMTAMPGRQGGNSTKFQGMRIVDPDDDPIDAPSKPAIDTDDGTYFEDGSEASDVGGPVERIGKAYGYTGSPETGLRPQGS